MFENLRTIRAAEALRAGDLAGFGRLMNESHISLRDDYEVCCDEVDVLTEIAWGCPGVLGSRITGGGFGGCTVSIVKNDAVDTFCKTLGELYKDKYGKEAEFYVVEAGEGAHKL